MPIKVGIAGFAHGHVHAYCANWRDRPELDVSVVATWDHDADRLKQNAEAYGLTACTELSDMFPLVDAVVVAAETSLHADVVEQAAAAGKAIIVQKPLALTLPQADRIVAAVEKAGVPFTLAWQMRTDPQNIQMKQLIEDGTLGKIQMLRRRHTLSTHLWDGFENTWHNSATYNRDIWADDSAHPIDLVNWLFGAPATVTAELETIVNPKVPNDNGIAIFRYPGGPLVEVVCAFSCPAGENTTEIVGDKGVVVQNYGDGPSAGVPRPEGACGLKWFTVEKGDWTCSEIASPPNHGPRIAGLSEPLAEFLHGKRGPICTAEEGRTSLRMVMATYVSSREGRRVSIDDPKIAEV